ncbi:alpha/beta fold hydrolase [Halomonas alimentaria]|uniref:Alpha/beta hydrolase n=1 Tax=Halomonas alimentaria TaxID=147248 RepID=A0A7X4W5I4_9GAMM|nr:acyl-CoA thioester hydrolase/BAAT C-terminal domain-containing protein [Halomonas alimentaria]NAW34694.1 alpha/beta hydrolase [Halomonas alimentaria]
MTVIISWTIRVMRLCIVTGLCSLLVGCVASSGGVASRLPEGHAAGIISLSGAGFQLAAAERLGNGHSVTVFIEGDGRPWISGGRRVSDDPTPRHTPMLRRFLAVSPPALYLGRPCYFGMGPEVACHPALWTFSRYSERVVEAMTSGLRNWLNRQPGVNQVTLIGHSGGGVLALLMAEVVPEVNRVITYAAPIDIDRWSRLHGFTPLFDSLNPSGREAWRHEVRRTLIFGEDDREVPPAVFVEYARRIPGAEIIVVPGANHSFGGVRTALD